MASQETGNALCNLAEAVDTLAAVLVPDPLNETKESDVAFARSVAALNALYPDWRDRANNAYSAHQAVHHCGR